MCNSRETSIRHATVARWCSNYNCECDFVECRYIPGACFVRVVFSGKFSTFLSG